MISDIFGNLSSNLWTWHNLWYALPSENPYLLTEYLHLFPIMEFCHSSSYKTAINLPIRIEKYFCPITDFQSISILLDAN